jgi:hypothetical protein
LQAHHVGQRSGLQIAEEIREAFLLVGGTERGVFAAVPGAIVVLHIDEQQRRVGGLDGNLAAQWVGHQCILKSSSVGRQRSSDLRAAQ